MPAFTTQFPDLVQSGPLVETHISVSHAAEIHLQSRQRPVPSPLPVLALVDTGATMTVLQTGLAAQLGLSPVGVAYMHTTSSTNVQCAKYLVRVLFPNKISFELPIVEAPLQGQNIQALIGRDILKHCMMVYIGHLNQVSISV